MKRARLQHMGPQPDGSNLFFLFLGSLMLGMFQQKSRLHVTPTPWMKALAFFHQTHPKPHLLAHPQLASAHLFKKGSLELTVSSPHLGSLIITSHCHIIFRHKWALLFCSGDAVLSSGVLCGLIVGTGSSISAVVATASTEGSTGALSGALAALAAPASMISKASGVAPLGSNGRVTSAGNSRGFEVMGEEVMTSYDGT